MKKIFNTKIIWRIKNEMPNFAFQKILIVKIRNMRHLRIRNAK